MSPAEIYIANYYQNFHAYLHGLASDPGNFQMPKASMQSYAQAVTVNTVVPEAYQWLYRRLCMIVEQQEPLIENIIVQGSYGDFTNNNYSDLDIILYLDQSVVESQQKRQLLRKFIQKRMMPLIYSIDPLQHHGVFLLWPELCDGYIESILPLVVYSKAWAVRKFETGFKCTTQKMLPRTPNLIQTILRESGRIGRRINFYYLKRLTSHIMIMPCLYFMDQGIYLHKANSFEPFVQQFPKTKHLFDDVSEIRNKWPPKPRSVFLMGLNNLGYHMFGKRYPKICGVFYRSPWIKQHVHHLKFNDLSKIVSL
jgi:hypothetical protein